MAALRFSMSMPNATSSPPCRVRARCRRGPTVGRGAAGDCGEGAAAAGAVEGGGTGFGAAEVVFMSNYSACAQIWEPVPILLATVQWIRNVVGAVVLFQIVALREPCVSAPEVVPVQATSMKDFTPLI